MESEYVEVHKGPFQAVLAYPDAKDPDGHTDVIFTGITPKAFFRASRILLKDSRRRHAKGLVRKWPPLR